MPRVILIAGPAGAGKTTLAQTIAAQPGWVMLSEDQYWSQLPRDPFALRSDADKYEIQALVLADIRRHVAAGQSVALEFIVYDDPPQPVQFYHAAVQALGIPVTVCVLRPSVTTLMARQAQRGLPHDTEVSSEVRHANALHQLRCLAHPAIDPGWVVAADQMEPLQIAAAVLAR